MAHGRSRHGWAHNAFAAPPTVTKSLLQACTAPWTAGALDTYLGRLRCSCAMEATAWTVADRLCACKDRRAKLLLSLDAGGAAAPVPPLAANGLRLYAWHAKAPGGLFGCMVCQDVV